MNVVRIVINFVLLCDEQMVGSNQILQVVQDIADVGLQVFVEDDVDLVGRLDAVTGKLCAFLGLYSKLLKLLAQLADRDLIVFVNDLVSKYKGSH